MNSFAKLGGGGATKVLRFLESLKFWIFEILGEEGGTILKIESNPNPFRIKKVRKLISEKFCWSKGKSFLSEI